ncbi:MAG TPA: pantetheine-phosphate adenylyltransferase [Candidatus Binatia bacterium]|nr:pantetheine-phosphate adenylyltransferase [Candidatus Binatia bacterium]
MTRVAVFPGSFDPMTNAHLDVARRASGLFDRLVIGVLDNPKKQPLFSSSERVALIEQCVAELGDHVSVEAFDGLTVDFATRHGAGFIVRGLRAVSDFEAELQMALTNRKLAPGIDTAFLMTALEHGYVSSSLAKEVARFGGDVSPMLPGPVAEALADRLRGDPRV